MKEALVDNIPARVAVAVAIEIAAGISAIFFHYPYWRWWSVASAIVFIGIYRSWRVGLVFIAIGVFWTVCHAVFNLLFFDYSWGETVLMKRSWTSDIGLVYGVAISGILSAAWSAVAGDLTKETRKRNGAPFTAASLTPDHVIPLPGNSVDRP